MSHAQGDVRAGIVPGLGRESIGQASEALAVQGQELAARRQVPDPKPLGDIITGRGVADHCGEPRARRVRTHRVDLQIRLENGAGLLDREFADNFAGRDVVNSEFSRFGRVAGLPPQHELATVAG